MEVCELWMQFYEAKGFLQYIYSLGKDAGYIIFSLCLREPVKRPLQPLIYNGIYMYTTFAKYLNYSIVRFIEKH